MQRGDIQPVMSEENLEYDADDNNGAPPNAMDDGLQPPMGGQQLYRSDSKVGVWTNDNDNQQEEDRPPYVPERRLIHFDLKGAPPKPAYLVKVLQLAKSLGATGVLMEYEDMFPFEGPLEDVAASNHYTIQEIKTVLAACEELELEVIPLVQTFGGCIVFCGIKISKVTFVFFQ